MVYVYKSVGCLCFFFQAEDGIRDVAVTGVQTCALPILSQREIDLVIVNGENAASGFGITPRLAQELLNLGVAVITGGNHSWDRKEILEYLPHEPRLLRPANFPEGNPGSRTYVGTAKNGTKYAVLNLQGRVFMTQIDDPFRKADSELEKLPADVDFVLVDMHAETTSAGSFSSSLSALRNGSSICV